MIKFKTVFYKNFLSAGDSGIRIILNKSLTTLITGANGTGKTTMIEAITFALFGKSFRQINKPQLVNSVNGKGCLVEIDFDVNGDEYKVCRGISPHIFTIEKNGVKKSQDADVRDYQKDLEQSILKMNYKAWTQVIVIGSSNFTPFMELSAMARREVVETILDISVFSDMNNILKGRMSLWKETSIRVDSEVSGLMENIKIQKGFIETMKHNVANEKERRKTKEAELNTHIENLKTRVLELKNQQQLLIESTADMKDNQEKYSSLSMMKSQKGFEIEGIEQKIRFFTDHKFCPSCNQAISEEHSEKARHDMSCELDSLKQAMNQIILESAVYEGKLSVQQELKEEMVRIASEMRNLSENYAGLKKQLDALANEKITAESDVETASEKLKEMVVMLKMKRSEQQELASQRDIYETTALLLKDSGVKKTIIKQYIPVINKLVNKYLQLLNFFVKFEIDAEFNEKIRSKTKEEFSYRSFSMGERARIDLALLFTWREIARMKNSINTNLLFFDEVFDSSLDVAGTEDLTTILDSLGGDINAFIISHRGDGLADKLRSHIHFEKEKGFSKIVSP